MSDQALQNTERKQALARQYAAPPSQTTARIPEIRLSVLMTKKQVPKGNFFILDKNVPEGDDPTVTDIGPEFECIVLRDAKKLFAFDSEDNKPLAESTEFRDFMNEPLFIIDNATERPSIVTVAPYTKIKEMKYSPTKDEIKAGKQLHPLQPLLKDLKLQYIAYVLYKPEGAEEYGLYLLKIGARGWLGMQNTGDTCKYGEEEDTSFIKAMAICHKDYPRTTHMHIWKMFSKEFKSDDGKDHYPAFEIVGQWDDELLPTVEEAQASLKSWLLGTYGRRIGYAWKYTTDREFIPERVAAMLDEAGGDQEAAAVMLGDRRQVQAKSSLVMGGQKTVEELPAPAAAPRERAHVTKSSKAAVEEAAAEFGAEEEKDEPPAPAPKPPASAKKKSGSALDSVFGRDKKKDKTTVEEATADAKAKMDAIPKPQYKDPNAPAYIPPDWLTEEERKKIDKGQEIVVPTAPPAAAAEEEDDGDQSKNPSDIPPGW